MADYIERDAAVNICSNEYKECLRKCDWGGDTVAWNIAYGIKSLPIADVAPVVHGEWEFKHPNGWACSNCGEWGLMVDNRGICKSNFCPNCGAKMDGGKSDGNGKV